MTQINLARIRASHRLLEFPCLWIGQYARNQVFIQWWKRTIVDAERMHFRADGLYVNKDRPLDFFIFFLVVLSILLYITSLRLPAEQIILQIAMLRRDHHWKQNRNCHTYDNNITIKREKNLHPSVWRMGWDKPKVFVVESSSPTSFENVDSTKSLISFWWQRALDYKNQTLNNCPTNAISSMVRMFDLHFGGLRSIPTFERFYLCSEWPGHANRSRSLYLSISTSPRLSL